MPLAMYRLAKNGERLLANKIVEKGHIGCKAEFNLGLHRQGYNGVERNKREQKKSNEFCFHLKSCDTMISKYFFRNKKAAPADSRGR